MLRLTEYWEMNEIQKYEPYEDPDWIGRIDIDTLEKLAALGYTPEDVARFFRIPRQDFMCYYLHPDSKIRESYERGILVWKSKDGMKMLEESINQGNVMQGIRLDKRRNEQDFQNALKDIVYGEF